MGGGLSSRTRLEARVRIFGRARRCDPRPRRRRVSPSRWRVACVIPTRNGGARFRELLAALQRQTVRCDVLIVDSNSTDDTCAIARAFGATVESIAVNE